MNDHCQHPVLSHVVYTADWNTAHYLDAHWEQNTAIVYRPARQVWIKIWALTRNYLASSRGWSVVNRQEELSGECGTLATGAPVGGFCWAVSLRLLYQPSWLVGRIKLKNARSSLDAVFFRAHAPDEVQGSKMKIVIPATGAQRGNKRAATMRWSSVCSGYKCTGSFSSWYLSYQLETLFPFLRAENLCTKPKTAPPQLLRFLCEIIKSYALYEWNILIAIFA